MRLKNRGGANQWVWRASHAKMLHIQQTSSGPDRSLSTPDLVFIPLEYFSLELSHACNRGIIGVDVACWVFMRILLCLFIEGHRPYLMDRWIFYLSYVIILDVFTKSEIHVWHVYGHHYHLISVDLVLAPHVKKLEDVFV